MDQNWRVLLITFVNGASALIETIVLLFTLGRAVNVIWGEQSEGHTQSLWLAFIILKAEPACTKPYVNAVWNYSVKVFFF